LLFMNAGLSAQSEGATQGVPYLEESERRRKCVCW
jgi:hypothetical protein